MGYVKFIHLVAGWLMTHRLFLGAVPPTCRGADQSADRAAERTGGIRAAGSGSLCVFFTISGRGGVAADELYKRRAATKLRKAGVFSRVDDSNTSIGKRYARNDELGTPYGLTLDFACTSSGRWLVWDAEKTDELGQRSKTGR